jgi:hypothetical protein
MSVPADFKRLCRKSFFPLAGLWPIPTPRCGSRFGAENCCECDRQHPLIGSVGNLNVPASPVHALLIAFRYHVMGHGDSNIPRSLKIRVPVAFGVCHEAAFSPDVEIVERCFRLRLQWRLRCINSGLIMRGRFVEGRPVVSIQAPPLSR